MNTMFLKLSLVNILLLGLTAIGFAYGKIQPIFVNDISYLSYIMSFVMGLIIIGNEYFVYCQKSLASVVKWTSFFGNRYLYIGLLGTLTGLSAVFATIIVSGSQAEATAALLMTLKSALQTTFNTTILGIVFYLWTDVILELVDTDA